MSSNTPAGRFSMFIDDKGTTGNLSGWPSEWEKSTNSVVNAAKRHWGRSQNAAQRLHVQYEQIITAKLKGVAPSIPDIAARRDLIAKDEGQLAAARRGLAEVMSDIDIGREQIKKRVIGGDNLSYVDALKDQEMRTYLRSIEDTRQRLAVLNKNQAARLASLRAEPELSGVAPEVRDGFLRREIETQAGPEWSALDEGERAASILGRTLETWGKAIANEKTLVGEQKKTTAAPWVPGEATA